MKKRAHIISHSHWDREWYLPYERHHMLQVEFMDTLLDTIKKDENFKSFHLDGQTIMIEDYLQVRPERKEELLQYIKEGRIHVGPWYILQDEWLTSSEANIRNLQVGMRDANLYGNVSKVGYFPDSFGNMGQAPQILSNAGIKSAAFGRGVKPTGFNNEVTEGSNFESQYSEMYWEAPDGSRVLGVLFANWYCNGMEVPTDEEEAKKYWEQRLKDAEKFASTDDLLFMNGCDHQPVQTDLSKALEVAAKNFPEVEFIHSNFMDYVADVEKNLRDDLAVVKGELRSQQTDGWYTLANTASARIYIKQMNARCEMLFEKVAEPIAAMAYAKGMEYPFAQFLYGWKLLMQNHPHDSICGCSVDEVHREMVTRFEKAEQVALYIIDICLEYVSNHMNKEAVTNKSEGAVPFFVANPTGYVKNGVVELDVPVAKFYFRDAPLNECIENSKKYEQKFKVVDAKGNTVPATVTLQQHSFGYDLPKDKFRQPFMQKKAHITMEVKDFKPFMVEGYSLIPCEEEGKTGSLLTSENTMENKYLKATVNENGSITVTHKGSNRTYEELNVFEDMIDAGNEYIFFAPSDATAITTKDTKAKLTVVEDLEVRAKIKAEVELMIPKSADEQLDREIADLVEFKHRKAGRSTELVPMTIATTYTLEREGGLVKVETTFDSQAMDHRVRALFPTDIQTDVHFADSIFEVAKRDNVPSKEWENPSNTAHQQVFVNVQDETVGLTIATMGLNEYEVLPKDKNAIAVTIHRGVRELGDWGIFPTPEAQCLGKHTVEYAIIPHGKDEAYASYKEAYAFQTVFISGEVNGTNVAKEQEFVSGEQFMKVESDAVAWTSLKVSEDTKEVVARFYNMADTESNLEVKVDGTLYRSNVLEVEKLEKLNDTIKVRPFEILTVTTEK